MATIQNGDSKDKFNEGAGVLGGAAKKGAKAAGKQLKKKIEKKTGQAISKLILSGLKTLFGFFAGSIGWLFLLMFCILSISAFINLVIFNRLDIEIDDANNEITIEANQYAKDSIAADDIQRAIVDRLWKDAKSSNIKKEVYEYANNNYYCGMFSENQVKETARGYEVDTLTCKLNFYFSPDAEEMTKNGGAYAQAIDSALIYFADKDEFNSTQNIDSTMVIDDNGEMSIIVDDRLDKPVSEMTHFDSDGNMQFNNSILDVMKEFTANVDINKSDFIGFLNGSKQEKPEPIYEVQDVPVYDNSQIYGTQSYGQVDTPKGKIIGYTKKKVKVGETNPDPDGIRYKSTRAVFNFMSQAQFNNSNYDSPYKAKLRHDYDIQVLKGHDPHGNPMYETRHYTEYFDGYKGNIYIPYEFDFTEYKEYVLEKKKDNMVGAGRCLIDHDGEEYSETCTPDEASQVITGLVNNYVESNMAIYDIDQIYYGMFRGGVAGYDGSIGYNSSFDYYGKSGQYSVSIFGVYNEYFNHIDYLFNTNKIHGAWHGRGVGSCTTVAQAWFYDVHGINSVNSGGSGCGRQFADNVLINWPDKFERGYSPAPGGVLSVNNGGNGHVICIDEVNEASDIIIITEGSYNKFGALRIRHKMSLSEFRSTWEKYSYTYANPKR